MCKTLRYSIAALIAALMVCFIANSADAGFLFRRNVEEQVSPPTLIAPTDGSAIIASPSDAAAYGVYSPDPTLYAAPPAACCPTPCISYRHAGLGKVKCCLPPVQTCLTVLDPCTCCPVNIPVCLPGCCDDCPNVSKRHGLFAKGIVTYDWCCGVSVTVRFQRGGDVLVTYRGV